MRATKNETAGLRDKYFILFLGNNSLALSVMSLNIKLFLNYTMYMKMNQEITCRHAL